MILLNRGSVGLEQMKKGLRVFHFSMRTEPKIRHERYHVPGQEISRAERAVGSSGVGAEGHPGG